MNPATIKLCAELCAASYDDSDLRFTTVDELRFGVIVQDGMRHIVHRGTDNATGWLEDFKAVPAEDFDGSLVHLGFKECTEKLMPHIFAALAVSPQDLPICVDGHSLGGSIAGMTTKRLVAAGFDAVAVTFGCPRYQSQVGENSTAITHYRIINSFDPVVHAPDGEMWIHTVEPFLDVAKPGDELSIDHHAPIETAYIARLAG